MEVQKGALIRAGGAAVAAALPDGTAKWQLVTMGATHQLAHRLDPHRYQLLSVTFDEDAEVWERTLAVLLPLASWSLLHGAVLSRVRRLPVPRPVAALAYGGLVYVADVAASQWVHGLREKAAAREGDAERTG